MWKRNTVDPANDLASIYWDAVHEVDPAGLIQSRVKKDGRTLVIPGQDINISEDLSGYKQIIILGIGKASARMASAMENILGDELSRWIYHHKIWTRSEASRKLKSWKQATRYPIKQYGMAPAS